MHTHRKRAEKARNEVTRLNFLLQHHDRLRKKLAKAQRRIQGMRNEAKGTQLRVDFLEEELGRAINDCVELGQIINLTNAARRRGVSDLEKAKRRTHAMHELLYAMQENLGKKCPVEVPPLKDCTACTEKKEMCLFLPCGHEGMCKRCSQRVASESNKCPFCRTELLEQMPFARIFRLAKNES